MRVLWLPLILALVACATGGTGGTGPAGSGPTGTGPDAAFRDPDGDGIGTGRDDCPNEPEDHDGFEDKDGCPEPDNDHDRIADATDRCPNDAETYNDYKDDDGCPDLAPQATPTHNGTAEIAERIYFAEGRAEIKPTSFPVLDSIAMVLKFQSQAFPSVALDGHAAPNERTPMRLSLDRASAVRLALIERGVDGTRLLARVAGPTAVACKGSEEVCWERERRVEFATLRIGRPADGEPGGDSAPAADARASDKQRTPPPATTAPLEEIAFSRGSAQLGPAALPALDLMAGFLKGNAGTLEIEGHAAENEPRPQDLAQARADAVRAYMIACGVNGESLIARAQGSAKPACKEHSSACRARNRRVELRFPEQAAAP